MKSAILFGASGNIGTHLLKILLESPEYCLVKIVVRKKLRITHPKLITLIGDYKTLPELKEELATDHVFIIIGSPDKEVERNYPISIARICKEKGTRSISIVTSAGADPDSAMSFTRVKGQIEQDILSLNFKQTLIYRPGMILGPRENYRPMEKTMMWIWKVINPLLVKRLRKYRGMPGKDIAQAMYVGSLRTGDGNHIYHWSEFNQLIKNVK